MAQRLFGGTVDIGAKMRAPLAAFCMRCQQHFMIGFPVKDIEGGFMAAKVEEIGGLIDYAKAAAPFIRK